ncbi:lamin tail domain-containing protein [Epilithonimonas zeae]|uniref:lamin tail domain-containing protein n=1 Tax=Epilithonimonas zeae TaxID=1416779 RepID=UPI00200F4D99|nr:lamin tail domain-containing protein [Epilithonimonas zeae]UQB69055.1 lamin tail domain-containing protein [Epilithonimonas zeae]
MIKKIIILLSLIYILNDINGQIVITEIHYDTPYSERLYRLNETTQQIDEARRHHWGEFIEIYNYSDRDLSLQNWYVQDKLGTAWLPGNKVIKSGELMVIAYSKLVYNTTPFTELFSRTRGKESQVILQDKILLRNKAELVRLGYHAFGGKVPLQKGEFMWSPSNPTANYQEKAWMTPDVSYNYNSYQLTSNNTYVLGPVDPLEAAYKPPIQKYEDIMKDVYQQYYSYVDWGEFVRELVDKICGISIPLEQQTPNGTYTSAGKCFHYDIAGNRDTATDCASPTTSNPQPTVYTSDELDEIKSYIAVYPNPATASNQYLVNVSWNGPAINKIYNIQIYNSAGGVVYGSNPTQNSTSASFSLANQLPGVFVINFTLNTGQVISKNILKW